jgi:sterol desaturase/sphingolipid hydroxylase (fatty acid hydroxylase superfamily)
MKIDSALPVSTLRGKVVVKRKLSDYLLFPVLLSATVAGGFATARLLNRHGWDGRDWKSWIAGWVAFWGFVVAIRFIEKLRPFEPAWNRGDDQLVNDIVLPLVSSLVFLAVPFAAWYANTLNWAINRVPQLHVLQIWPTHWPAITAIPIGVIILDLGPHLAHRWSHTTKLFWRFHSVHHSAPRLCVINTARAHPGNLFIIILCGVPIPTLLGVPAGVVVWYSVLTTYTGFLTHANIDMPCGIFSYVINTPELHRWHHSRNQKETDTNFGEVTVLWDHLFGTYFHPKRRPPRDVGVDFPVSTKIIQQLIQPMTPAGHRPGDFAISALPAGEAGIR